MTYPVQKPPKLIFRNDRGRTSPLSSVEIDGNFVLLDFTLTQKLDKSDYTSNKIIELLNADKNSSKDTGIDAGKLAGKRPTPNNIVDTVVLRDNLGNFGANEISAKKFIGESTKAVDAKTATKLKTPIKINGVQFDGSYDIDISDQTKISKSGDTTTGKIKFTSTNTAPINIGLSTNLPTLSDGDLLYHGGSLKLRVGGVTKKIAFQDDNINGNSVNVSGVVEVVNGGTGATTSIKARENLFVAKRGKNDDISELVGLTVALASKFGGTGLSQVGESGNIMVSNGTSWESKTITEVIGNNINDVVNQKIPHAIDNFITDQNFYKKDETGFSFLFGNIIVNWGSFDISETSDNQIVSFCKSFPNKALHVFVTQSDNSDKPIGVINKTKQYATITKSNTDKTRRVGSWIAIGY